MLRKEFLQKSAFASLGVLALGKNSRGSRFIQQPNSKINGVQVGVITYSFRSLPGSAEQTLGYCVNAGISAIELMGDSIEEFAGAPKNPVPWIPGQRFEMTDEKRALLKEYQKQLAAWRETAPMDGFAKVREMYNKAGVSIYAFKPNALNPNNSDKEIDYAMRAAKTLGAVSVTTELLITNPDHSKRLGEIGKQNKVFVGYHAHTQATDSAWDLALSQSDYNSINLDCGHYIAAGGNNTRDTLLKFINDKHARISSMHLKDRTTKDHGGKNLVWGTGDTPLKEILLTLRDKKYNIPATIELEYDVPADSDAVKETRKCLDFARAVLTA